MPSTPYTRLTASTAILTERQDPNANYTSLAVIYDLLNDAMGDWCEMARLRLVNRSIAIVGNQPVYSLTGLAPRCIEIVRASVPTGVNATDDYRMELLSQMQLDDRYPAWRSQAAYWPFALIRDVQGPQSFRLFPTPASSQQATVANGTIIANQKTGIMIDIQGLTNVQATALTGGVVDAQFLVGAVQLYYIAHSTDIADDATTVETACGISPDFQDALIWYVSARLCEIDTPISQAQKAQTYWSKWANELAKATQMEKSAMQVRPPRSTRLRPY